MKVLKRQKGSDGSNSVYPLAQIKESHPKIDDKAPKAREVLVRVLGSVDMEVIERLLNLGDPLLLTADDIRNL